MYVDEPDNEDKCVGRIYLDKDNDCFKLAYGETDIEDGVHAIYLIYHGDVKIQIKDINFNRTEVE